ncbi:MAG: hypothetical protein JWM41_3399 [Gemmatimonadetes bacterium]|nr:hypothetical protein [Gemmatimonadota bacterium]
MAALHILTEPFTGRLKRTIPEHLDWYTYDESFAEDFSSGGGWDIPTNVEPQISSGALRDVLTIPEDGDLKDLENSIRLHKALPSLTPVQARDPRLWTRLTHVEFWPYMRTRWPIERYMSDRQKAQRYIEGRYFVTRSEGRALLRNGIARLWWYAHLTHDDARNNPYELTAVLLNTLDITQQILERSLGRCEAVLVGFLEFLLQNPRLLERGEINRATIRDLAKSLNLFGGVAVLDCLTPGVLKQHLHRELSRIETKANGEKAEP